MFSYFFNKDADSAATMKHIDHYVNQTKEVQKLKMRHAAAEKAVATWASKVDAAREEQKKFAEEHPCVRTGTGFRRLDQAAIAKNEADQQQAFQDTRRDRNAVSQYPVLGALNCVLDMFMPGTANNFTMAQRDKFSTQIAMEHVDSVRKAFHKYWESFPEEIMTELTEAEKMYKTSKKTEGRESAKHGLMMVYNTLGVFNQGKTTQNSPEKRGKFAKPIVQSLAMLINELISILKREHTSIVWEKKTEKDSEKKDRKIWVHADLTAEFLEAKLKISGIRGVSKGDETGAEAPKTFASMMVVEVDDAVEKTGTGHAELEANPEAINLNNKQPESQLPDDESVNTIEQPIEGDKQVGKGKGLMLTAASSTTATMLSPANSPSDATRKTGLGKRPNQDDSFSEEESSSSEEEGDSFSEDEDGDSGNQVPVALSTTATMLSPEKSPSDECTKTDLGKRPHEDDSSPHDEDGDSGNEVPVSSRTRRSRGSALRRS